MQKTKKGSKLPNEEIKKIRELYRIFPSISYVARETGHDYKTVKKYIRMKK